MRRHTQETTKNKDTGTRPDMLKTKKNSQATLVNLIKLESGQTHPAHIFGGFHVFLHKNTRKKKSLAGETISAGVVFVHLSPSIPAYALKHCTELQHMVCERCFMSHAYTA